MLLLYWIPAWLSAHVLTVGIGSDFDNLSSAAGRAAPGDTVLFRSGAYDGDQFIENLRGTADGWISILSEAEGEAVIRGGGEAWHFIDAEYVRIRGFTFERQSGNGVNADDGGDYSTPSHHLVFDRCAFRDMESEGNSDLLKLSGVDAFEVRECAFLNGSSGGSGIDMVGCHKGMIRGNRFENMGSNAIQAKGGSNFVRIAETGRSIWEAARTSNSFVLSTRRTRPRTCPFFPMSSRGPRRRWRTWDASGPT
jgi:hypothetical protein